MRTPPEVAKSILAKLAVTAPELSCELGTPERKIIDAVAEAISEADVSNYLTGSLLDIDTKAGLELEQFVGIFGFGRFQGRPARGVVRVELSNPAPAPMDIPVGTEFHTKAGVAGVSSTVVFASTQPAVIPEGGYSADVPVEATQPGAQGNVPPDSVIAITTLIGTATCTNLSAMTGGVDVETDDELRARFKDTFLRNISGTDDWYRGVALGNNSVSKVAVFGPTTMYRTQIAVPSTTLSVPVHQDVKYAWPKSSSVFVNLGEEDQTFYSEVIDYNLSSGSSPVFERVSTGELEVGEIVNLEFEYTTQSSRNDPANGIFNKVDVYVDGIDPYTVTERTVVTDTYLSDDPGDELYIGNFRRMGTTGTPSEENRFMRLGSVPLVSFPSTITIDSTVYSLGTHYHILVSNTLEQGSIYETAGLEWLAAGPSSGSPVTISYVYNRTPQILQAVYRQTKQITTDVLVHQANYKYLKPCLTVQFDRSYSVTNTTTQIGERLRAYFAPFPFGAQFKLTDLLVAVRSVPGVANVSITTSTENPSHYGIEIYDSSTDIVPSNVATADFKFNDNVVPVFMEAIIRRQATP